MSFGVPKEIEIRYDDTTVQSMLALLKSSPFPDKSPIDADTPWKLGIDFDYLKKLKNQFENEWSWTTLEKKIAKFDNYLVHYEHEGDALDLHYVHVKSPRSDAIPLILLHGWPGTFFDFHKVVEPLTNPKDPNHPAFHVVVPSLPGFFLSTLPRHEGWGLTSNARLFNGLMTSVLGYKKYVGQGGDWGCVILRIMASAYPESVSLAHFNMIVVPFPPDLDLSSLSESEKHMIKRGREIRESGFGYFNIQSTKPITIGIAIASSPLAILTYIGEKVYSWSDPELVDPQDILDTVALYYLSGSFATSVVIYHTSSAEHQELGAPLVEEKFLLKNKFGFSVYPYEAGTPPKVVLEALGPLAFYKVHSNGGHFPALDNPVSFVSDLREFVASNKD